MQSHLFNLSLRCWVFWVLFRKIFPTPIDLVHFLLLPGVVSKFLALYYSPWSTSSWYWYRVKDRDLFSVFLMWISTFPRSMCWRNCLFSIVYFGLPCQNQLAVDAEVYVLVFYSDPLVFLPVFVPVPCCFLLLWLCSIVWSQILCCPQYWTFCSELLCLFVVFCVSISMSGFIFLFLFRMWLEYW
jgi:hypothetical protein